jgi:hypothetical protein
MTYETPVLLLVGSAKTLVRGSTHLTSIYSDDNVPPCGPFLSRDKFLC